MNRIVETFLQNRIVPIAEIERKVIMHALSMSGDNLTRAARALGVSKMWIYRRLKRYRIPR